MINEREFILQHAYLNRDHIPSASMNYKQIKEIRRELEKLKRRVDVVEISAEAMQKSKEEK